jgi:hypothetical protein
MWRREWQRGSREREGEGDKVQRHAAAISGPLKRRRIRAARRAAASQ